MACHLSGCVHLWDTMGYYFSGEMEGGTLFCLESLGVCVAASSHSFEAGEFILSTGGRGERRGRKYCWAPQLGEAPLHSPENSGQRSCPPPPEEPGSWGRSEGRASGKARNLGQERAPSPAGSILPPVHGVRLPGSEVFAPPHAGLEAPGLPPRDTATSEASGEGLLGRAGSTGCPRH